MQSTFTAALEAGGTTFVFQPAHHALAREWEKLAKFRAVQTGEPGTARSSEEVILSWKAAILECKAVVAASLAVPDLTRLAGCLNH